MKFLFTLLLVFASLLSLAQRVDFTGILISNGNQVPYAKVQLLDTDRKAISDEEGTFTFEQLPSGAYRLATRAVGFEDDTIAFEVSQTNQEMIFDLSEKDQELNTVVVTGTMRETTIAHSPVKIEVLNHTFFRSNPVNSLIEAMETVNGVQEQVNCGVCGTNDIHINGMEGPYTLVLIDGMPIVSGLSSVYGFNGIPTSIIERVEIIKGPSSTLYGTEAVGGIVNIITKSSQHSPLVFTDTRLSTHQELKTELSFTPKISKQVMTTLSGDFYWNQYRIDFNEDGFTDIPLHNRLSLFNKWQFLNKKGKEVFSIVGRYYEEDRFGGQLNWQKSDRGSSTVYGESIYTKRWEAIGKYQLPIKNTELSFSANRHEQDAFYGDVSYSAVQNVFFSNLIHNWEMSKRSVLTSGFSNRYTTYTDNTPSQTDEQTYVPGIFFQNEFNWTEDFIVLSGIRADYHTRHGVIISPRLALKKTVKDFTNFRLNYGTGFRQVYLFTEDHAFISGARDVLITEDLNPERSHNISFNMNHTYAKAGYGNLDVDLFYTYFSNKIIPDFDTDPNLIIYQNLAGYGITRGISFAINHKFKSPLRIKLGTTFMNVYEVFTNDAGEQEREQQVFAPTFSGVFSVGYEVKKWGLSFNYNGKVIGPQRLPEFADEFSRPTTSPWFTLQHCQVTKVFGKTGLEIYGGVKNIFNYTQDSPLINPAEPYSDSFDTSYAYGPLQVRRYFFGLRYSLSSLPKKK